jgi:hypothetical protein
MEQLYFVKYRFPTPPKIPTNIFMELDKLIRKFIWENRTLRTFRKHQINKKDSNPQTGEDPKAQGTDTLPHR